MSLVPKLLLLLAGSTLLGAQDQPPQPAAPALVYQGKPLRVPIHCRAEDFEQAGLQCSDDEPCRLFLELTTVEAQGPKIVVAGNIHTPTATLSSIALFSDDAGSTWREALKRQPSAGVEAAQFLNEQQGWIAVQPHGQLASDPYLLGTTDGGAKWETLRIWNEEGRAGVLQQFYFDGKDHGFAIIDRSAAVTGADRYELYETPNGGLTWALKETSSRPITPKWPPRRTPDWRLREDAKLKTYELERRVADHWRRMANFYADLGACKDLQPKKPAGPPAEPANP